MKAIFTIIMSGMMIIAANAQTPVEPVEPVEAIKPNDPIAPIDPESDFDDTTGKKVTKLSFGTMKVIIYEEENDKVEVTVDSNGDTTIIVGKDKKVKKPKFNGTWEGFSICGNGMLTYDNKTTLPENMRTFEIDYARSVSAALNLGQVDFGINPHFGFTTGLGLQWNRYGIKNNYNMTFNEDSIYGESTPDYNYNKNVLKATYLTMPLLFEIHTNKKASKSVDISFGVIGGYKLGSRLKQEYEYEGHTYEFKTKGHYHFSPFQAYATARVGFGGVQLFANYGLTRIFDQGRGPQLYPFQVGLHFYH